MVISAVIVAVQPLLFVVVKVIVCIPEVENACEGDANVLFPAVLIVQLYAVMVLFNPELVSENVINSLIQPLDPIITGLGFS